MKKKPKQNNTIEFKQVKSTKNRRMADEKQTSQEINKQIHSKQTYQFSKEVKKGIEQQNLQENFYKINFLPYANDFESCTYQSHYKASTLSSFKETLNEFSTQLSNTEIELANQLIEKQKFLQNSINEINDQFERISQKLIEMRQTAIKQMQGYIVQMKLEYKSNLKQLTDMQKSITRYLADINLHYEDIVKELEFKCFEDIMAQYESKLQYFEEEVKWILEKKDNQPNVLVHNIKKLLRHIEKLQLKYQKLQIKYQSKPSDREMENNFIKKPEPLLLGDQIISKRVC